DQQWLIKAAAVRGKWIDQSQSLNIFYSGTSGAELANVYMYAWQAGLKTTYYLRTLGASGIEQSTVSLDKQQNLEKRDEEVLAAVAVAEIKEELASHDVKPESVIVQKTPALTLCKIDDPNCESCQ
ncbi:MAG: ribonucleoside-diphosphate reductase subunit alpha, partial [Candidatus Kaiserbacteria bacterium]|nr:ribonucleoside-diphosphate reductase subunit alpha [Candidatus Kaiserbacteria bacterium]